MLAQKPQCRIGRPFSTQWNDLAPRPVAIERAPRLVPGKAHVPVCEESLGAIAFIPHGDSDMAGISTDTVEHSLNAGLGAFQQLNDLARLWHVPEYAGYPQCTIPFLCNLEDGEKVFLFKIIGGNAGKRAGGRRTRSRQDSWMVRMESILRQVVRNCKVQGGVAHRLVAIADSAVPMRGAER
jgi:hypothetical protein